MLNSGSWWIIPHPSALQLHVSLAMLRSIPELQPEACELSPGGRMVKNEMVKGGWLQLGDGSRWLMMVNDGLSPLVNDVMFTHVFTPSLLWDILHVQFFAYLKLRKYESLQNLRQYEYLHVYIYMQMYSIKSKPKCCDNVVQLYMHDIKCWLYAHVITCFHVCKQCTFPRVILL